MVMHCCSGYLQDRLVYHLFEHDMHMTMVKHRPPLITYAELTLPLPSSKLLWLAASARIWRAQYFDTETAAEPPSLKWLLQDEHALSYQNPKIDSSLARSMVFHGIAAQIWAHTQQSVLLSKGSDASSQLWAQFHHEKL
jgi:hypothetical protein